MDLKERLIDYLSVNEFDGDKNLLMRLQNYINEEIKYNNTLLNYGFDNLEKKFENVLYNKYIDFDNKYIDNVYDLTDKLFEDNRSDGTLTFSTLQSEQEMLASYDLNEINEIVSYDGFNSGDLTTEQIHILICEKEFTEYLEEKLEEIKNEYPKLNDRNALLKTCLEISNEKELNIDKKLLDKAEKEINTIDNKTKSKSKQKGMER